MNIAPPTRTRSVLKNRALAAAYAGAHFFAIEVFEPATANTLMAALLVADLNNTYILSGEGDVIEPDDACAAIGSGGGYAKAAAIALLESTKLSAREIVERAMKIAADACIYTNHNIVYQELG